jgi:hypothetical protein
MGKLKSKYAKGVDDLAIDQKLNNAESAKTLATNFGKDSGKYISFKEMSKSQQAQYRAGQASGEEFTVDGIGNYLAQPKKSITPKPNFPKQTEDPKGTIYPKDWKTPKGEERTLQRFMDFVDIQNNLNKENYKPNVEYNKPESLTDTTKKQLTTKTLPEVTVTAKAKSVIPEFNLKSIMGKTKELASLRSSIPGFGPFRTSANSKLVGDIDNINSQLYKISQKQSAFERNKTRGLASEQALQEAKAREQEFLKLTKNLKLK